MITPQFPTSFKAQIINIHGDKGQAWLNDLPHIIEHCQTKFNIKINKPLPRLSFNYANAMFDTNKMEKPCG